MVQRAQVLGRPGEQLGQPLVTSAGPPGRSAGSGHAGQTTGSVIAMEGLELGVVTATPDEALRWHRSDVARAGGRAGGGLPHSVSTSGWRWLATPGGGTVRTGTATVPWARSPGDGPMPSGSSPARRAGRTRWATPGERRRLRKEYAVELAVDPDADRPTGVADALVGRPSTRCGPTGGGTAATVEAQGHRQRTTTWPAATGSASSATSSRCGARSPCPHRPPRRSTGRAPSALRPFRPGHDEAAWLVTNNRAFATHPEQGHWDLATLLEREREAWFDPEGFLILEVDGRVAGLCWTKIHAEPRPPMGEIYVISVDPDFHGRGWGRALTGRVWTGWPARGSPSGCSTWTPTMSPPCPCTARWASSTPRRSGLPPPRWTDRGTPPGRPPSRPGPQPTPTRRPIEKVMAAAMPEISNCREADHNHEPAGEVGQRRAHGEGPQWPRAPPTTRWRSSPR